MPGVREGIEQARYEEAEREIVRAARAVMREADLLDQAAADLEHDRAVKGCPVRIPRDLAFDPLRVRRDLPAT